MGFVPIAIDKYVAMHLANNPTVKMYCTMTRYGHNDDEEFNCFAFIKK